MKNLTTFGKWYLLMKSAILIIIVVIVAVHEEPAYLLTLDNMLLVMQFEAAIFLKHLK